MFGKRSKMSTNEKAIMAMGRANGNLSNTFKGTEYPEKRGGKNPGSKTGPNPYKVKRPTPGSAGSKVKLTSS